MQPPDIDTKPLSSGQAAKRTGTSTDTLRHYEKLGLLSNIGRTAAGYRLYSAASIERINLIRSSLGLGFSLRELNGILRVRDRGGAPCQKVRAMLVEKVTALDQQIEQLIEGRAQLRDLLADWEQKLSTIPDGSRAHLLESLRLKPTLPKLNKGIKS